MRARILVAIALLILAGADVRAAEPAALPPAVGLNEAEAKQRTALFAELAATKNDAEARAVEERIWTFWRSFADAQSREGWKPQGPRPCIPGTGSKGLGARQPGPAKAGRARVILETEFRVWCRESKFVAVFSRLN